MNLGIRKLAPDLAKDYIHFFDATPHDNHTDENKCYCVTWRSDASYAADPNHWYPTREERRSAARRFVQNGDIQGYLAYQDGEIVGWCNATGHCRSGVDYLRSYWPIEEHPAHLKVKSVFCFVIAPKVQRTGVATKLLEYVCQDAEADGYDIVEAYVNQTHSGHDFRGPLAMYEKCGFTILAAQDGKAVVRKTFKRSSHP